MANFMYDCNNDDKQFITRAIDTLCDYMQDYVLTFENEVILKSKDGQIMAGGVHDVVNKLDRIKKIKSLSQEQTICMRCETVIDIMTINNKRCPKCTEIFSRP